MTGADQNPRRPMSLDDLFAAWHRLGRLEFSPDGQRIVYEYNDALWITDWKGTPERLTEGRSPLWSPASEELAFLRGDPPQIWTRDAGYVDPEPGALWAVGSTASAMGPTWVHGCWVTPAASGQQSSHAAAMTGASVMA
jgi:dipeptidyl aminopeptidase/acylaminoacyl peptidase